jgi:hypothetical protein
MSKALREFFEQSKDEGQPLLPGLSLSKFFSEVGSELSHQVTQGAHELSAAMFTGSAYVMYPRHEGQDGVEHPLHGLPEEAKQQEVERGGMEM